MNSYTMLEPAAVPEWLRQDAERYILEAARKLGIQPPRIIWWERWPEAADLISGWINDGLSDRVNNDNWSDWASIHPTPFVQPGCS